MTPALSRARRVSGEARLSEEDRGVLARLRASLPEWLALVDRLPPAELIDHILASSAYGLEIGGVRGHQARENVKKMRGLVRRIQNRGYATLGRIAEHLDRLSAGDEANATIEALDAVSLMTVHASKGLEFPVVFLVNIARGVAARRQPIRVLVDPQGDETNVAVESFISEADTLEPAKEREETKRLLYVALTRARDTLYLSTRAEGRSVQADAGQPRQHHAAVDDRAVRGGRPLRSRLDARVDRAGRQCARVHQRREADRVRSNADTATASAAPALESHPCSKRRQLRQRQRWRARRALERLRRRLPALPALPVLPVSPKSPESRIASPTFRMRGPASASHRRFAAARRGLPSASIAPARAPRRRSPGGSSTGLFQARADADAPVDALSRHALRLMRGEEQLGLEAPDEIARQAAETFQRVAAREDIRTLLTSGACLYEVPFSLRLPSSAATPRAEQAMRESGLLSADAGSHLIVRGTIDALVRQADGAVVVVEFKTGAPHVDHHEQLEMYVEAARAMFPGAAVTGRLIYP